MEEYGNRNRATAFVRVDKLKINKKFTLPDDPSFFVVCGSVTGQRFCKEITGEGTIQDRYFHDDTPVIPVELVKLTWRDKG